jgi:hypothetical protein
LYIESRAPLLSILHQSKALPGKAQFLATETNSTQRIAEWLSHANANGCGSQPNAKAWPCRNSWRHVFRSFHRAADFTVNECNGLSVNVARRCCLLPRPMQQMYPTIFNNLPDAFEHAMILTARMLWRGMPGMH